LALSVTALLVASPVVVQHAGIAVAEIPLVLQHACCLVLLLQWMIDRDRRNLIAAAAFAAFAAFTKNEGLALLPLVGVISFAFAVSQPQRRRLLRDWAISGAVAIALIAPWSIYRHALPRTHEDYGTRLTDLAVLARSTPRLSPALGQFLGLLLQPSTAGGLWVVLGLAAAVGWRRFGALPVVALWSLLLAHMALYVLTFVVTPWDLAVLLPMVGPKLLMHAAPTAVLLIGLHLSDRAA
jgi:hypothetical protein